MELFRKALYDKCQSQKELRRAAACGSRARVLHLELHLTNSAPFIGGPMDCLWALALALRSRSVTDGCAWDLAALKDTRSLHTLTLYLDHNSIGARGAQALAALKDAPSLHTLTLDLSWTSIGARVAQALAALKDAPLLHTLALGLSGSSIGDGGAQALAALKDAPSLHALTFDLSYNSIGDGGAQALAALKDAPSLHTLRLHLSVASIGRDGFKAMNPLQNAPSLAKCTVSYDDPRRCRRTGRWLGVQSVLSTLNPVDPRRPQHISRGTVPPSQTGPPKVDSSSNRTVSSPGQCCPCSPVWLGRR